MKSTVSRRRVLQVVALAGLGAAIACLAGDGSAQAGRGSPGEHSPSIAMYRGTPDHTGMAAAGERLSLPLERVWTYEPVNVGIHTASKSSPVADETKVYVGADNERLYALDKVTGKLEWRWVSRPCRNGIHATPAVDGDRVYIGDYAGWLSALDKSSGDLVWERKLGDHIGGSPVLVGDRLLVGVELDPAQGFLAAVDPATGRELWTSARLGDHTHCTPTVDVDRGRVFLGSNRGHFHCFDLSDGREVWRFAARGALEHFPPRGHRPRYHAQIKSTAALVRGRVLFTSWDRRLYCLDAKTGEEQWSFVTGKRAMSSPTVDVPSRLVLFGSHDRTVYAVELDSGEQVWKVGTDRRVYSSGVVVERADGEGRLLVIGSSDRHVYVIDVGTGTVLAKLDVAGAVTGVPLVSGGRLYVSSNGGELVCWE